MLTSAQHYHTVRDETGVFTGEHTAIMPKLVGDFVTRSGSLPNEESGIVVSATRGVFTTMDIMGSRSVLQGDYLVVNNEWWQVDDNAIHNTRHVYRNIFVNRSIDPR